VSARHGFCDSKSPTDPPYLCSLAHGHEGDHQAHGFDDVLVLREWPQSLSEPPGS